MIDAAGINHCGHKGLWPDAELGDFEKVVTVGDELLTTVIDGG
jgi:hypothetical protein